MIPVTLRDLIQERLDVGYPPSAGSIALAIRDALDAGDLPVSEVSEKVANVVDAAKAAAAEVQASSTWPNPDAAVANALVAAVDDLIGDVE